MTNRFTSRLFTSRFAAVSTVAAAIAIAGCGGDRGRGDDGITADLERDLALATAPRVNRTAVVSAVEGGPTGAPSGSQRGQRAPVRVNRRAPAPQVTDVVQEVAAPETASDLPAPPSGADISESAPAPAPVTEPEHAPAAADVDQGTIVSGPSANGSGEGQRGRRGGLGGLIGAVLRGGGVDGDNCERHDTRRRGGGTVVIGGGRIPAGIPGGIAGAIGESIRIGAGGRTNIPINDGDRRAPVGRPTFPRY